MVCRHSLFIFVVVVVCAIVNLVQSAPKADAYPEAYPVAEPCCRRGASFIKGAIVGAAISRIRNRNNHYGGGGYTYYGGGGGYGYGGGYGGGCGGCCGCGRKKRGIPGTFNKEKLEHYHKKMAAEDQDQCGLRLLCGLAQKEEASLTGKEKLVLLPYSGAGSSDGTSFGLYDEAAWHGTEGHDCHLLYPLCSFQANHIMDKAMNLTENDQYNFI